MEKGTPNSIVTSFNRNFTGRNDGNPETHAFVTSPEMVVAMSVSGDMTFNPMTDAIPTADGGEFRFTAPKGDALPANGYDAGEELYEAPAADPHAVKVDIAADSERLQALQPWSPWDGKDLVRASLGLSYALAVADTFVYCCLLLSQSQEDMPVLIKTKGKTTTDHISQGGPWLKYRGHLENISENCMIGATSAEGDKVNQVTNQITGEEGSVPATAKAYRDAGVPWVIIGDHNYGEGSSREHAAMEPRFLGGRAVITRSFARIHETNLKKQGMLPFTFADEADYERVPTDARVSIRGLAGLAPGSPMALTVKPAGGAAEYDLPLNHTFNAMQLKWMHAGSALNIIRAQYNN